MQLTRAANMLYQRRLDGQQALQPRAAKLPPPDEAQRIRAAYCANVRGLNLMSPFDPKRTSCDLSGQLNI